ncbi:Alpha-fucosidase A [Escovopsis weberi]|uniref:Alpha-fucosidase A n=1 Tax=Escovopsis weberi TaxID=150374 RepID=A0A0M9VRU4_ESCWE|nr:Alpha-fucosidase A [Escovopsis weberi]
MYWASLPLGLALASAAEARKLWASTPATYGSQDSDNYLLKTAYPVGNGKLGAVQFGAPGAERISLNADSLWSGGPFEDAGYQGGNPQAALKDALPGIRQFIFQNGIGNVTALYGDPNHYGSYRVLANLTVSIDHGSSYSGYRRTLDLETSTHTTTYRVGSASFSTSLFCSYPAQACVYQVSSNKDLPAVEVAFENQQVDPSLVASSCAQGLARHTGVTQKGTPEGMKYDAIARLAGRGIKSTCEGPSLKIAPARGRKSLTFVVGAGTNFDQTKGNKENNYSFKGADPAAEVELLTTRAATKSFNALHQDHLKDYQALFNAFTLDLPDNKGSASKETASIIQAYSADGEGDAFVDALLFDLGRFMLICASRENSLPANLQGVWASEFNPAWSADYHANINVQMNYWSADQTGLSRTSQALWNYMQHNWAPRGAETAELLYGAKGWVTHSEMNIFGHTGMKNDATWTDYPASAAWMMLHVWDNFEYTQDMAWLRSQGYPLLKAIAEFWLTQLQDDAFFHDGTLVVNPCNSPEHGPTTFGCAHFQQLIQQVFEATLTASSYVGDRDRQFLAQVSRKLAILDKGVHVAEWGGLKEWKLPDSYGQDAPNTHRHLSHLVGWFPGYSVSSFEGGYTDATIQSAVAETLATRGPGNADDANSGWEKVWRAACWARLNNTERAYYELKYAIDVNFADNGFSMYQALSAPFQIDANLGLPGAVLAMLIVDLPVPHGIDLKKPRTVILGPAIPREWGGGSVKGMRLRGGRSVDFSWDKNGKVDKATLRGSGRPVKLVNVDGKALS